MQVVGSPSGMFLTAPLPKKAPGTHDDGHRADGNLVEQPQPEAWCGDHAGSHVGSRAPAICWAQGDRRLDASVHEPLTPTPDRSRGSVRRPGSGT
jgi:hypothetical protein